MSHLRRLGERAAALNEVQADDARVARIITDIGRTFPDDRRHPWTLLCALAALEAYGTERHGVFWGAGVVVVQAYTKSQRAAAPRAGDQLSVLLREFLARHPDTTPIGAWQHCVDIAQLGGDETIADYDPEGGFLSYFPRAGVFDRLVDITYEAFARRVRRAKGIRIPDISAADVRRVA